MIQNYVKILSRNLLKNKFFSLLNMLGLAVGMTCYLVIVQYVNFEFSYDGFHENNDNVYRLKQDIYVNNVMTESRAIVSNNVGPVMKTEYPEIKEFTRLSKIEKNLIVVNEQKFSNEKIFVADPTVFKVFTFPALRGDVVKALEIPDSAVITQSAARKYFGNQDPMGKMIEVMEEVGKVTCQVNGILKDVPENSHLKFDILLSYKAIYPESYSDWVFWDFYTYFLLNPGADPHKLEAKFPQFIQKYIIAAVPLATRWKFSLQPLKDIYLYSDINYDTANGNGKAMYFLLIAAFLILVISWINYVNLSTARSMERAREVGVRKVLGSYRMQLIKQFLSESLLINIIPVVISVVLSFLFLPVLRDLTGKMIPSFLSGNIWFPINLFLLYVVGSLLSGLYPALVLSSFKPVTVLKRTKLSQTTGGNILKKALVIFQFMASSILIIAALTVYSQINFLKNKDLGINFERLLGVELPATPLEDQSIRNANSFKTEILKYPGIESVAGSTIIPGSDRISRRLSYRANTDFTTGQVQAVAIVDYDFIPTYRIKLIAGRNFSKDFITDTASIVINEESLKILRFENPQDALNQDIIVFGIGSLKIIGVMKNYHIQSLKRQCDPMILFLQPNIKNYYSIKFDATNKRIGNTISLIKETWDKIFPGIPFNYYFIDDRFNNLYKDDMQFGKTIGLFVILALLVTCMGLLGLTYFSTVQRTKEIGIRKVFGANVGEIVRLFTNDIVKLVAVGVVLSWPIAYWAVDNWLKNYAYRITMPWIYFVLSGVIIVLIALATVSYHAFGAARMNPVTAIREE